MAAKFTIAQWRRLKNITQSEMGRRCGVSLMSIRYWEEHPNLIKMENAYKVAEALGVDFSDIIFLPEESTKSREKVV